MNTPKQILPLLKGSEREVALIHLLSLVGEGDWEKIKVRRVYEKDNT